MDAAGLFSVAGRVALVTGGSAGIGRMIATGLAAAGARVYICARDSDKVAHAVADIGGDCIGLTADVATLEGIAELVAQIAAREPALHILVNNAGTLTDAPLDAFSEDQWDDVIDLNLKTPFFLMQQLLPQLRAGASADRPSNVINIGSVGALKIGPREVYSYQASKGAIHWLTRSLAKKLGPQHITVNAIAPGFFESDMTVITDDAMRAMVVSMVPRGRTGTPEDMAGAAIYLASRAGAYVTGSVLPVEGGLAI
ncbi:MAG: SDR family oxidoreductase [Blastomonas sp.]|jgi:NAD(P)-dependent dehydrogenase (short-subunit alcohol dehydrogenase family)|uniref:SDR family oxidoreductase n=1 Tax=Blastomonas TaxID=150203 RepID=UPI0006B943DC|nr:MULTISPECIES: SDR family oxidoreductase [unclassified Blastomonas]AOG00661.1 short chain dehydrogenase family protein [Blastomonas sp. RAC04]KPF74057.1 3-oxoacyl-ACP reductase [Blastomonas sp. AAP25]MCO5791962.1 SDR family oxidoreductase [Blastomonas sp.]